MLRPTFNKLKQNYRVQSRNIHSCSMKFPNTCAIRMSEALVRTDPKFIDKFKASTKNKCPHNYMRGAQDLGSVLANNNIFGTRDHGWGAQSNASTPPADIIGKKGIVCYMNIPTFNGQGHIDLWHDDAPVGQAYWNSETIWFWELK